jgi:phage gp46-like protein
MDINLAYNQEIMEYDISITSFGDLAIGDDLKTAVLTSLFTWERAKPDDYIPEGESSFGWWGEELSEKSLTGSRLWLLQRAKLSSSGGVLREGLSRAPTEGVVRQTAQTANIAVESAQAALEWLKDEGIASSIDVNAEHKTGVLTLDITITRYGGEKETLRYSDLWGMFSES